MKLDLPFYIKIYCFIKALFYRLTHLKQIKRYEKISKIREELFYAKKKIYFYKV